MSVVVLALTAAWGAWLIAHARTKASYVTAAAAAKPTIAVCEWLKISESRAANLGFSIDESHAWTDRATAYLGVPVPDLNGAGWLDLDIAAVAAHRATVRIDRGERYVLRPGQVRLRLPPRSSAQPLLLTFTADGPKPPSGADRRWLGVAVSRIRACPA
ncbi:hypothetical protein GCM10008101_26660 [Lysobacter xinjiangensis]|uniref:Uncharacterized protein n=1 Tax=Cognatilysobacter xinjiangensis TaxID=546892 RepID=A0ABQ3C8T1_9GAMM|nr:hypothetical protein GCM10008101_26660 [Lysobacter xinjiangensis]